MTGLLLLFAFAQDEKILAEIIRSGQVVTLTKELDDGIRLAPGAPPLLAFRYLEGKERGRHSGLDLVVDDAGH